MDDCKNCECKDFCDDLVADVGEEADFSCDEIKRIAKGE